MTSAFEQLDQLHERIRLLWETQFTPQSDLLQEAAEQLAQLAPYPRGKADHLTILALKALREGDNERCIAAGTEALSIYEGLSGTALWSAAAAAYTALAHRALGNLEAAFVMHRRQLDAARETGEPARIAAAVMNLGTLYLDQGDTANAQTHYQHAYTLYMQGTDRIGTASLHTNMCKLYSTIGNLEAALHHGQQALALFEDLGSHNGMANAHNNLGSAYGSAGNLKAAEQHYRSAMDHARQAHSTNTLMGVLLALGRLYRNSANQRDALTVLGELRMLAERSGAKVRLYECHQELSALYEQFGDDTAALEHYKQFHLLKAEVFSEQNVRRLQQLEVQHRTQQAEAAAETERRLREQEHQSFERVSRMKDEWLATASHDLKNPLASILISVELLRRRGRVDDERGRELLDQIQGRAELMRQLIAGLLDMAQLETVGLLPNQAYDLTAFLREASQPFEEEAHQHGLTLTLALPATALEVRLDRHRMQQVIQNLLSNAIKFTLPGGSIVLSAGREDDSAWVRVRDTGIGIPPEALPHIFERFYRVPDDQHQRVEGTGLGLAIVKRIVDQHSGQISVESPPGGGTQFTLRLPLVESRLKNTG